MNKQELKLQKDSEFTAKLNRSKGGLTDTDAGDNNAILEPVGLMKKPFILCLISTIFANVEISN